MGGLKDHFKNRMIFVIVAQYKIMAQTAQTSCWDLEKEAWGLVGGQMRAHSDSCTREDAGSLALKVFALEYPC